MSAVALVKAIRGPNGRPVPSLRRVWRRRVSGDRGREWSLQWSTASPYDAGMKLDWTPLKQLLEAHERFLITSHVRPDADAIGSEMGLASLLQQRGKQVRIVNPSGTPPNLRFLDPAGVICQLGTGNSLPDGFEPEVFIVVDTSAWVQLSDVGRVMRESSCAKVVIDHHQSSDDLGAIVLKDTTREATGSLIVELAEALGEPIAPAAATALYAAIATDTGWFRFSAVTGETMRTIGLLIDAGASPADIYRELYEQATIARIHLAGRVLSRVKLECDGVLAWTFVEARDFEELGAQSSDTEDLVNECLKITGTRVAFIAIEQLNRQVKVSFRSRTSVNVAKVAEQFGGGGHKQAAGATFAGPVSAAVDKALAALKQALPSP